MLACQPPITKRIPRGSFGVAVTFPVDLDGEPR
jgi:hypothetical protein